MKTLFQFDTDRQSCYNIPIMRKEGKKVTRADILAIVFIILTIFIFFYDFIIKGFIFFHGDLPTVHYPLKSLFKEEILRGYIPLWNPYTGAGSPVFAQAEILPFYIFNILLFLILPISTGIKAMTILHLFMGGISIFFFMRILGCKPIIAIVPAITFIYSAYSILHIHIIHLLCGAMWVPLILVFLELYIRHQKIVFLLLASGLHIIQLSGSHPQSTIYSFAITIPYFAWRYFKTSNISRVWKKITTFFLLLILFQAPVSFISAVEIIPIIELTPHSLRQGGVSGALTGYTVPADLLTYIFPTWFLGRDDSKIGASHTYTYFYYDFACYVGVISLILALIAIFKVKNEYVDFFASLFFAASILRLGFLTPLYTLIMLIPGFNYLLSPIRFSQITTLALAVLSGFGLKYLLTGEKSFSNFREFMRKRFPVIIIYILLMLYPILTGHAGIRCINVKPPASFLGLHTNPVLIIIILFLMSLFIRRRKNIFTVTTILFITCDLFIYGINYNPRSYPEDAAIPSEHVKFLQDDEEHFRVYPFYRRGQFANSTLAKYENLILTPDLNAYYGISSTLTRLSFRITRLEQLNDMIFKELYDIFHPIIRQKFIPRVREQSLSNDQQENIINLLHPLNINRDNGKFASSSPTFKELSIFNISNIKYLLTPEKLNHPDFKLIYEQPIKIYENGNYLPRAYFVSRGLKVTGIQKSMMLMMDKATNLLQDVILEDEEQKPIYIPESPEYNLNINTYEFMKVEMKLETNQPGYLVLSDTYYPGWTAEINGAPAKILRANYLYRALRINDAGKYDIRFEFKPFSYKIGLYFTLVSIALSCLLLLFFSSVKIIKTNSTFNSKPKGSGK